MNGRALTARDGGGALYGQQIKLNNMKRLTLLVVIAWVGLLSYKESPKALYNEVKRDMIEEGYVFPKLWYEDIQYFWDKPNFYGLNPSMGSLASNVTILVNYNAWKSMNKTQKKLLILHEMIHSLGKDGNQYHCRKHDCVMSPHSIDYWKNKDYEQTLKTTLLHHNLLGSSNNIIIRF